MERKERRIFIDIVHHQSTIEKKFVDVQMESDFIRALESQLHAFSEAVVNRKASRAVHVATSRPIDAHDFLKQVSGIDRVQYSISGDIPDGRMIGGQASLEKSRK